jgi:hypothetical protein
MRLRTHLLALQHGQLRRALGLSHTSVRRTLDLPDPGDGLRSFEQPPAPSVEALDIESVRVASASRRAGGSVRRAADLPGAKARHDRSERVGPHAEAE